MLGTRGTVNGCTYYQQSSPWCPTKAENSLVQRMVRKRICMRALPEKSLLGQRYLLAALLRAVLLFAVGGSTHGLLFGLAHGVDVSFVLAQDGDATSNKPGEESVSAKIGRYEDLPGIRSYLWPPNRRERGSNNVIGLIL